MCKNFVQVSIVTEYNIIFMWPRVTLSYRAWSQFMKPDWDSFFYRSMCAEHKGEHLSFPCVPQAAQPAVTSERSNLFHSIVPSYKSWSPECVRLSVCENIPNTTYQSNQPNHTATHTNTHPVNMEYIYLKKKSNILPLQTLPKIECSYWTLTKTNMTQTPKWML